MTEINYSPTISRAPEIKPLTVSAKVVAEMIGLKRTTINKLRKSGCLRSCKVGGARLYFVESIEAFLANSETEAL